jgi:hypothetical protein
MKAEMYKYLHEIKDNTDKKLNELREDTNWWLNEIRKIIQDMKEEFTYRNTEKN